jgi:hypothetical protein
VNFNLVSDPWIQVLMVDGRFRRLGLLDVLNQAGEIKDIVAPTPMDKASIIRLLLTILYWNHGNPPSDRPAFPEDWSGLVQEKEYFNLFGEKRFFQIPDINQRDKDLKLKVGKDGQYKKSEKHSPFSLLLEIPNGSLCLHFDHGVVDGEGLGFAACAMALVRLVSFCAEGGQGKLRAIHGPPCVHRFLIGNTLADTLLMQWRPRNDLVGQPSWLCPDQVHDGKDVGFYLGMTFLPRNIWLCEPEEGDVGNCYITGERGPIVRECHHYRRIGQLAHRGEDDCKRVFWNDPTIVVKDGAILYESKEKKEKRLARKGALKPKLDFVYFDKFGNVSDVDIFMEIFSMLHRGGIVHPNYMDERAVGEWWVLPTFKQFKLFQCAEFMMRTRDPEAFRAANSLMAKGSERSEINQAIAHEIKLRCENPGATNNIEALHGRRKAERYYMLAKVS